MDDYQSISHTTWTYNNHVLFIPKCRRKTSYLELRRHLGCSASSRYKRNQRSRGRASHARSRAYAAVGITARTSSRTPSDLLATPPKNAVSQVSEQALVATLAEMYVQGVSTRKVKGIAEGLCGHAFSASAISAINKRLDESLAAFATRLLAEPFPYLILEARHEKVREAAWSSARRC